MKAAYIINPRIQTFAWMPISVQSLLHTNPYKDSVLVNRGEGFCHAIDLKEYSHTFEDLLKNMAVEYAESAATYRDMIDLMLRWLLITLYRCKPALFLPKISQNAGIVTEIQSLFEQNYPERFTLAGLSEEYHISHRE